MELNANCENRCWFLVGITNSTSRPFPDAHPRLLTSKYQSVSSHSPFWSCTFIEEQKGTLAVHSLRLWVIMLVSSAHVLVGEDIHRSQGSAWSGPETCHSKVRGLSSITGLKDNVKLTMAMSLFLRVEEWWTVNPSHSH